MKVEKETNKHKLARKHKRRQSIASTQLIMKQAGKKQKK